MWLRGKVEDDGVGVFEKGTKHGGTDVGEGVFRLGVTHC